LVSSWEEEERIQAAADRRRARRSAMRWSAAVRCRSKFGDFYGMGLGLGCARRKEAVPIFLLHAR
jgi:hypothetical protein